MKYQTYYLSLIEKILIKCQNILKNTKPKKINVKKNELKINLDYKLNKAICEELRKTKIDIISEENNNISNLSILKNKKNYWIVDPLDGSTNLLRNIPFCSICISLVLNRKFEISFIYDISKHDKYIAYNNKIFVNGIKKTFYRKILNKKSSILVTGFPHKYNFKKKLVNFKKYNKIRMIGCASLSMLGCMQGNFDWYQEKNIMLWDVAAGYHFNILNNCIVHKFDKNKIIQEVSLGYCK